MTCCALAPVAPRRAPHEGELPLDELALSALLARLSYEEPAGLAAALAAAKALPGGDLLAAVEGAPYVFFDAKPEEDAQAYIWTLAGGKRVVAFRGTANAADAMADLNVARSAAGEGKAHRGFLKQFAAIEKKVAGALAAADDFDACVFCGHSLARHHTLSPLQRPRLTSCTLPRHRPDCARPAGRRPGHAGGHHRRRRAAGAGQARGLPHLWLAARRQRRICRRRCQERDAAVARVQRGRSCAHGQWLRPLLRCAVQRCASAASHRRSAAR